MNAKRFFLYLFLSIFAAVLGYLVISITLAASYSNLMGQKESLPRFYVETNGKSIAEIVACTGFESETKQVVDKHPLDYIIDVLNKGDLKKTDILRINILLQEVSLEQKLDLIETYDLAGDSKTIPLFKAIIQELLFKRPEEGLDRLTTISDQEFQAIDSHIIAMLAVKEPVAVFSWMKELFPLSRRDRFSDYAEPYNYTVSQMIESLAQVPEYQWAAYEFVQTHIQGRLNKESRLASNILKVIVEKSLDNPEPLFKRFLGENRDPSFIDAYIQALADKSLGQAVNFVNRSEQAMSARMMDNLAERVVKGYSWDEVRNWSLRFKRDDLKKSILSEAARHYMKTDLDKAVSVIQSISDTSLKEGVLSHTHFGSPPFFDRSTLFERSLSIEELKESSSFRVFIAVSLSYDESALLSYRAELAKRNPALGQLVTEIIERNVGLPK